MIIPINTPDLSTYITRDELTDSIDPVKEGAWSPLSNSTLEWWFRADKGVTVTTNVDACSDQSSHGRNTIPNAGDRHPPLVANGINGLPSFAQGGQALQSAVLTNGPLITGCTIVDVLSKWPINAETAGGSSYLFQATYSGGSFLTYDFEVGELWFYVKGAYGHVALSYDEPIILVGVYDSTQSTDANKLKVYVNGVQKTLSFVGSPSGSETITQFNIGTSVDGGVRLSPTILMAEHMFYSSVLSDTGFDYLYRYINNRYGDLV